ncbi:hypothetical protein P7C71_g1601, partial [Lecanoromycetidae sp. Uapishka_2]
MAPPILAVLGGQRASVMRTVVELSKPEFEPIHAILSREAGVAEIPAILRGEKPSVSDPEALEVGTTNDYSKPPQAIVLGGGYGDEDAEEMRKACKGHLNVPWMLFDKNKPVDVPLGPEYAKIVVGRGKELLAKLQAEGKLGKDGIYYY